jgi:hypothetical protein
MRVLLFFAFFMRFFGTCPVPHAGLDTLATTQNETTKPQYMRKHQWYYVL